MSIKGNSSQGTKQHNISKAYLKLLFHILTSNLIVDKCGTPLKPEANS